MVILKPFICQYRPLTLVWQVINEKVCQMCLNKKTKFQRILNMLLNNIFEYYIRVPSQKNNTSDVWFGFQEASIYFDSAASKIAWWYSSSNASVDTCWCFLLQSIKKDRTQGLTIIECESFIRASNQNQKVCQAIQNSQRFLLKYIFLNQCLLKFLKKSQKTATKKFNKTVVRRQDNDDVEERANPYPYIPSYLDYFHSSS